MIKKLGLAATLALTFMSIGFIMMGVAWNGAASKNCIQCQLPYILSGSIPGLGLVILGAGLLLFEAGRRMLTRMEARLDALTEAVRGAPLSAITAAVPATVAPAAAKASSSNGSVVIGRNSFHRPDCRLVAGKDGMDTATPDEASARGLYPCRVCDPTSVVAN